MATGTAAAPQGGGFDAPLPPSSMSSKQANPTGAAAAPAAPSLSPADVHVLLVDDERMQRMVVASLLRKCSYKGKSEEEWKKKEIEKSDRRRSWLVRRLFSSLSLDVEVARSQLFSLSLSLPPKPLLVTDVESGLQAIEKLRSHPPGFFDLVLTDVMMPDVDGVELLRHVRAEASLRAVPVVMMSANEHAETVFECIRLGAEDYLLKPVGRKEVQHIWQHVWRRQRAVREGGGGGGDGGGGEGGGEGGATATEQQQHQQQQAQAQGQAPAADASAPSAAAAAAADPSADPSAAAQAASEAAAVLVEEEGEEHGRGGEGEAAAATATATATAADASSPPAAATSPSTTTSSLPLRPSLTSPSAAAAAAASARTFPRAAPNALTLSEYLRRRGTRPAPLAAFKLFCSALALLRPLHSAGGCLLRLRPSALVLGAGGALSPCAPATADGRVPPEEEAGYAAPEQLLLGTSEGNPSSSVVVGAPADVYALGVLFLELFCPLPDEADRASVLAALRHRILPSQVLASRPREAAFVTALVHPDAALRPTIDAILTSGWLPALRDAAPRLLLQQLPAPPQPRKQQQWQPRLRRERRRPSRPPRGKPAPDPPRRPRPCPTPRC
jgi:CheY-like chemotaxis protein